MTSAIMFSIDLYLIIIFWWWLRHWSAVFVVISIDIFSNFINFLMPFLLNLCKFCFKNLKYKIFYSLFHLDIFELFLVLFSLSNIVKSCYWSMKVWSLEVFRDFVCWLDFIGFLLSFFFNIIIILSGYLHIKC